MELVADKATKAQVNLVGAVGPRVQRHAQELGVIIRPVLDILTFSPPLVLTREQADVIVNMMDQAIGETVKELRGA